MSSPWAKITVPEPTNLEDIMSEELAKDLQTKENEKHAKLVNLNTAKCDNELNFAEIASTLSVDEPTSSSTEDDPAKSDLAIALLLQRQFDLENNYLVNQIEDQVNGLSNVGISFKNYLRTPQPTDMESEEEEEELVDVRDRKDWDRFDSVQRKYTNIPPCGYKLEDGNFITKHDTNLNGQRNVCRFMTSFPPEFETGDGGAFDFKLSNKVFNSLRLHSKNEQNRKQRIRDKKEDQATSDFGVDQYTRLILYKMVNGQLFERVNGIISIGKEAVIIHADIDQNANESPFKECVLKIFKTTLAEFKQRDKYIKDDYRFAGKIGKQRIRKTINIWAEKEMHNLCRLQKAGIPCPEVIAIKKHVLVMSFIGENHQAAPKLKDAHLSKEEYDLAYTQVVTLMKKMYEEAHLIHCDLSEYNILWHENQCYFIDVSQSTVPTAVEAFQFLHRDCVNVTRFFERRGVENVRSSFELFQHIAGCDFGNKIELENIQKNMKMKPHHMNGPEGEFNDTFNLTWDKIETEKLGAASSKSICRDDIAVEQPTESLVAKTEV